MCYRATLCKGFERLFPLQVVWHHMHHVVLVMHGRSVELRAVMWPRIGEELDEFELPCEPAGHGEIATGNVSSCAQFWRTFV